MKKTNKLKLREKIALGVFMEIVPKLVGIWKEKSPEKTFDEFCLSVYDEAKNKKKEVNK